MKVQGDGRASNCGAGFTLVETLVAIVILLTASSAALIGIHYAMIHAQYMKQAQVALNTAQGRLEQLSAMSVDLLLQDPSLAQAQASRQLETPAAGSPFAAVPNARLAVQVRTIPPGAIPPINIVDVHVAACWTNGRRTIGEGGTAAANGPPLCQDTSGDPTTWAVDSPIMVSTRVARKE